MPIGPTYLVACIGSSAVSLYTNPASNYHRGLTVSGTNLRDRATPQRTRRQHHG